MNKPEWIETKKECDVDEHGKLIIKKVTLERTKRNYLGLEKKDIIDISIRLISLGAIFIPLLLFYKQQKAERDKQKTFFQLELYSGTTTELHSLMNKPLGSLEFDQAKNRLLYEIYPKLRLLSENVVTDTFLVLKDVIAFSSVMSNAFNAGDSLKKQVSRLTGPSKAGFGVTDDIQALELLAPAIQDIASSQREILHWESETTKGRSFTREYQQRAGNLLSLLRIQSDSLIESTRLSPLAADSNDRYSPSPSPMDSVNTDVAVRDRLYYSFDMLHALRSSYANQFNNNIQNYTSKLDSIMAESTKLLYSK